MRKSQSLKSLSPTWGYRLPLQARPHFHRGLLQQVASAAWTLTWRIFLVNFLSLDGAWRLWGPTLCSNRCWSHSAGCSTNHQGLPEIENICEKENNNFPIINITQNTLTGSWKNEIYDIYLDAGDRPPIADPLEGRDQGAGEEKQQCREPGDDGPGGDEGADNANEGLGILLILVTRYKPVVQCCYEAFSFGCSDLKEYNSLLFLLEYIWHICIIISL